MSNDSESEAESADEQVDESVEEETVEEESVGFEYGDFIRLAYVARTVEDGNLVDTTDQEVAEEEGVDSDRELGPRTIVLGEGHIFESVEEAILGAEVGDTGTTTVPAQEAFGEYDEEKVRTVSKDKIPEDDQFPGAQVTIDGQQGFIETIIGGRARVDFNHPLAGDDIEYDWEVVGTVDDPEERAQGLLQMFLDIDLNIHFETDIVEEERLVEDDDEADADDDVAEEETDEDDADAEDGDDETAAEDADDDADDEPTYETVEVEKESLYIEATPQLTMNQQWMMQKQQIGQQLIDLLGIDRIVIQEVIEGADMGGMLGGLGGMGGGADLEAALEEAGIDADDIADDL